MRHVPLHRRHPKATLALAGCIAVLVASETTLAAPTMDGAAVATVEHLLISEVMTGGAGASDEFVELYNPAQSPLGLEGLELVYVTASGATVTRKASWGPGVEIGPGGHLLVVNEAGIFAGVADATYAGGLAATGGSMALRAIGAATTIDAVGWGTATSAWLEPPAVPAPPAGSGIERLPGGELGSGQDTDSNLVDFVVRAVPDPQNTASPPVPTDPPGETSLPTPPSSLSASPTPSLDATPPATPDPTPSLAASPTATPIPTPAPTPPPTATPALITIAEARGMPDDANVTVVGVSLTDSAFGEGGGYLADATSGIAVLVSDGAFPRGVELLVRGTVDDRFAQRTIRAEAVDIVTIGPGTAPVPAPVESGLVGEPIEGRLVSLEGQVNGAPTVLSAGLAFEVDDGSGPVRVLVGPATGIDTTGWLPGVGVSVIGVVGQRDSSGTGAEGYRVQPRDAADVLAVLPPATLEPTPTPVPTPAPSPSPAASPNPTPTAVQAMSIAAARAAATGAPVRIRGVVTLPTGLVESGSAVLADSSGAILVRSSSNIRLRRGQLVEVSGTRSTKSGMASIRIGTSPTVLGAQADPAAVRRATGRMREADEALLVVVRGLVRDGPRRTIGGGLTLTVNDGSGALRVFVAGGTGISTRSLPAGAWVEVRGVVGQQTTAAAPSAGYRLWPRDRNDVRVIARATPGGGKPAGTAKPTTTRPGASVAHPPAPAPLLTVRPRLGGAAAPASATVNGPPATDPQPLPGELHGPFAASLAGLAGLLTLAWRTGTWGRLQAEVGERGRRRLAPFRTGAGDVHEESYTLAP